MPIYDGSGTLFGVATSVHYGQNQAVRQENQFFGLTGTQSLHGGTRGTPIQVKGVLVGSTIEDVGAAEQLLNSYVDGVPRTFVDNFSRTYDNVVVTGFVVPDPIGIKPCQVGWCMPYTITLQWLV